MDLFVYFFVAFFISALGSIPIGLITLTIVQRTIDNGKSAGILIASGACIMEFSYTFIAIHCLDFLRENISLSDNIKIFAVLLFFALGINFFFKKEKETKPPASYNYFDFFRGIVTGMMNVLIIPFWFFIGIWLRTQGISFMENFCKVTFAFGSAFGALSVFLFYVYSSEYVSQKSATITKYTNKAAGIIFVGLGLFQLVQIL